MGAGMRRGHARSGGAGQTRRIELLGRPLLYARRPDAVNQQRTDSCMRMNASKRRRLVPDASFRVRRAPVLDKRIAPVSLSRALATGRAGFARTIRWPTWLQPTSVDNCGEPPWTANTAGLRRAP